MFKKPKAVKVVVIGNLTVRPDRVSAFTVRADFYGNNTQQLLIDGTWCDTEISGLELDDQALEGLLGWKSPSSTGEP